MCVYLMLLSCHDVQLNLFYTHMPLIRKLENSKSSAKTLIWLTPSSMLGDHAGVLILFKMVTRNWI